MIVRRRDLLAIIIYLNLISALRDSVKIFGLRNGSIQVPGVAEYSPRLPQYSPNTRIPRQTKASSLSSIRQWTQRIPITGRASNAKVLTNVDAKNDKDYITITPTVIRAHKREYNDEEITAFVTDEVTKAKDVNSIKGGEIEINDEIKSEIIINATTELKTTSVISTSFVPSTLRPTTSLPRTRVDNENTKTTSSVIFDALASRYISSISRTTLPLTTGLDQKNDTTASSVIADSLSSTNASSNSTTTSFTEIAYRENILNETDSTPLPFTSTTPPTTSLYTATDPKNIVNETDTTIFSVITDSTTSSLITNLTSLPNKPSTSTTTTPLLFTPDCNDTLQESNLTAIYSTRNYANRENVTEVPNEIQIPGYKLPENGYLILMAGCVIPVVLATILLMILGCQRKRSSREDSTAHLQTPITNVRARRFT